jgi:hypothetical protein
MATSSLYNTRSAENMYGGGDQRTKLAAAKAAMNGPTTQTPLIQQWKNGLLETNANNSQLELATAVQSVPTTGDEGLLIARRVVNFSCTADDLAKNPALRVKRSQTSSKIDTKSKLIPLSSVVTHIKNTSSTDLVFQLEGTPVNAACSMPEGCVQADIFLPAATPLTQVDQELFTCDPKKASDIDRFNGWHKVTPESLESAVLLTTPDESGRNLSAWVRCKSPLYDMISPSFEKLGLRMEGPHANAGFHTVGDETVLILPDEIARAHIQRGKELINNLPFKKPSDMQATVARADGKSFTDVAPYVGKAVGSEHMQDIALRGPFQATAFIKDIYRIWHE